MLQRYKPIPHWIFGVTLTVTDRLHRYTTKSMLKEIKVRIEESDLAKLDAEAINAGTNRSAYIRERLVARMTTADYHRIVADACRRFHGDASAIQIQAICAYVITQAKASN